MGFVQPSSAGAGVTGPALPVGRYFYATPNTNSGWALTRGQEYCVPLALPGAGTIASVAVYLWSLSTEVGALLRLGVRADAAGRPGAVLAETSFSADTTTGVSGLKELAGLTAPYGSAFVWVSILGQWTTTGYQMMGQSETVPLMASGVGASAPDLTSWNLSHNPQAAVVAGNFAGTIASGGALVPASVTSPISTIVVKRGT